MPKRWRLFRQKPVNISSVWLRRRQNGRWQNRTLLLPIRLYQMAKGRYQNGTISENEMLQLEINRLNEETNVMDAQVALREKMQTIRSFLGLEQSQDICLVMPDRGACF